MAFPAKNSGAAAIEGGPKIEPESGATPVLTSPAMNILQRIGFGAVLLCAAFVSHADENFRCGQSIVSSDMTLGEIVGQPASREKRTEPVKVRNRNTGLMVNAGETTTETLTWNRGTLAEAMVVTVVDGKVRSIERKR
jgi:hypothetical protein